MFKLLQCIFIFIFIFLHKLVFDNSHNHFDSVCIDYYISVVFVHKIYFISYDRFLTKDGEG